MKVLLIGNYLTDEQESMQRFCRMLETGLLQQGISVRVVRPQPFFNRWLKLPFAWKKWLGYLDKYVLFPWFLVAHVRWCDLVHICDQGNAMYVRCLLGAPAVLTCHDLLAVRAALGEDTACSASASGKILQQWILSSISLADMIACDSTSTRADVLRLAEVINQKRVKLIEIGLNYPYARLSREESQARLARLPGLQAPFILHVGSNERRKNRAGILRIFAKLRPDFAGQLVFAGEPLSNELKDMAAQLGVAAQVLEVRKPADDLLEALYNEAFAMLFPSLAEGFGWPVVEAQACGCPVVISKQGPLPEIAGGAALMHDVDDELGFVASLLSLRDSTQREQLIAKGAGNVERFAPAKMIAAYLSLYQDILKS